MRLKTIILIILCTAVAIILIQNTQTVSFKVFFWEFGISRIILIPMLLLMGFFAGYAFCATHRKSKSESVKPSFDNHVE